MSEQIFIVCYGIRPLHLLRMGKLRFREAMRFILGCILLALYNFPEEQLHVQAQFSVFLHHFPVSYKPE